MNITEKEMEMLKATAENEYGDEMTDAKWTWSVLGDIDEKIIPEQSSFGGIVASLVKKGLIYSDSVDLNGEEATLAVTNEGAEALIEKYGYAGVEGWLQKYEDNPETAKY